MLRGSESNDQHPPIPAIPQMYPRRKPSGLASEDMSLKKWWEHIDAMHDSDNAIGIESRTPTQGISGVVACAGSIFHDWRRNISGH